MDNYTKLYEVLGLLNNYKQKRNELQKLIDCTKDAHAPILSVGASFCDDSKHRIILACPAEKILDMELNYLDEQIKQLETEARGIKLK